MQQPRRLLVVVLMLLGLTSGACGAPEPNPDATPDQNAADARVIQHAMGSTEITGTPRRVIVLDTGELDSALALGVTPVGAVRADAASGLQPYLAERSGEVELVGTIGEPNLETIAALRPDLILSSKMRHEELYGKLSAIAPTVFAETVGITWKENFLLAGDALGRRADAERILADYEQKATRVGQQFGDPSRIRVSMLRFIPGDIRLYGQGSFIGTILRDTGLARPESQQVDRTFVEISAEEITLADGDLLFYSALGVSDRTDQTQVTMGPLWPQLGAVSAGNAHAVSDDLWYLGIGPIAADLVLDDLSGYAPR